MQNHMLNIFDTLTHVGFKFVIDIGKANLFIKTGEPRKYQMMMMMMMMMI